MIRHCPKGTWIIHVSENVALLKCDAECESTQWHYVTKITATNVRMNDKQSPKVPLWCFPKFTARQLCGIILLVPKFTACQLCGIILLVPVVSPFVSQLVEIYANVNINPLTKFKRPLAYPWQTFTVNHYFCTVPANLLSRECRVSQLPESSVVHLSWSVAVGRCSMQITIS